MGKIEFKSVGNIASSASFLRQEFRNWIFKTLFFVAGITFPGSVLVLAVLYFSGNIGWMNYLMFIVLGLSLYCLAYKSYLSYKLSSFVPVAAKTAKERLLAGENINIYSSLSPDLADKLLHLEFNKKAITGETIIKKIARSDELSFVLNRLGIGQAVFEKFETENVQITEKLWVAALDNAIKFSHAGIDPADLLVAMVVSDKKLADSFDQFGAGPDDIENVSVWKDHVDGKKASTKGFFNPNRLRFSGGIGRDWAYGYTNYLRQYAIDVTEAINQYGLDLEIVGKDKETDAVEEALTKTEGANAVIVGDPGVGKRTVAMNFIKRVAMGEINSSLAFRHVFEINVDHLLSGASESGEISARLTRVLDEASGAGNVIVFIDNISTLLSSGDTGKVDATGVLGDYLSSNNINFIFTLSTADFNSLVQTNKTLMEKIQKIEVSEPSDQDVIQILEKNVFKIEGKDSCFVTYETIKEVIKSAQKYILNLPNPEKSISLLDSVCSKAVAERGETVVLPKDVSDFISQRYKVPGLANDKAEKEKLLNLETEMHQSIVGQDRAIEAISNAMRRARSGITDSAKPIGSFLFMGPTGVGKTETAKTLARIYFGDESRMIRFDMTEYQNKEDVYRLIGSNVHGENELGTLASSVLNNPFSLILLDEIEKAHPDILNIFLQVLDEGILTSGLGQKISFSNTIIIATSNAGSNFIRESVQKGLPIEDIEKQLLDQVQKEAIFKPEFLNRFNKVVVFHPLDQNQIGQVAKMMIEKIKQAVLQSQGVSFEIDDAVIVELAKSGFDPEMGARPMSRAISEKIEDLLARKILSNELARGQSITIIADDIR